MHKTLTMQNLDELSMCDFFLLHALLMVLYWVVLIIMNISNQLQIRRKIYQKAGKNEIFYCDVKDFNVFFFNHFQSNRAGDLGLVLNCRYMDVVLGSKRISAYWLKLTGFFINFPQVTLSIWSLKYGVKILVQGSFNFNKKIHWIIFNSWPNPARVGIPSCLVPSRPGDDMGFFKW